METKTTGELDRRALLKGAAAGAVGTGVLASAIGGASEARAEDKGALKDNSIIGQMVEFKSGADTIHGYLARPKTPGKHGAVILIPGIFGLEDYMKETTAQLAQAGFVGLAVDFYSRKGGAPQTTDFNVLRTFVSENAPDKQIVSDGLAAIAYLKGKPFVNGKFGVTGFCMGGRITLAIAEASPSVVAASPYYGPLRAGGPTQIQLLDHPQALKAAVQGHYGANDMNPKPDDVKEFYAKVKETNPHAEYFIYEGASHAFHAWNRPSYNPDAATKAWNRTLDFFKERLQ